MKARKYYPSGWQVNADTLKTEKVQLWSNGVVAAIVDLMIAKEMVESHKAFVICDQAIGRLHSEGFSIA